MLTFSNLNTNQFNNDDLVTFYQNVFTQSANAQEGETVGELVKNILKSDKNQWLCHVATNDNSELLGAVIWTRVLVKDNFGNDYLAYLMSPVAVASDCQKQGIGQSLINYGLNDLRSQQKVDLVVSYGDPNYYKKVGFKPLDVTQFLPPYPLSMPFGWIGQSLNEQPIEQIKLNNPPICIDAFCNPLIW